MRYRVIGVREGDTIFDGLIKEVSSWQDSAEDALDLANKVCHRYIDSFIECEDGSTYDWGMEESTGRLALIA